jgi:hypothetical protein
MERNRNMSVSRFARSRFMTQVDDIVRRYVEAARGDRDAALRALVQDALADLCEAERRSASRDRLISRGYARAALAEKLVDDRREALARVS